MFEIGDRVAYSKKWLQSVGAYDYDTASLRGTVLGVAGVFRTGYVLEIKWDGEEKSSRVLDKCLVLMNKIHLEPA